MAKTYAEVTANSVQTTSLSAYDSTKLNLGEYMHLYSGNPDPRDNFFGPAKIPFTRPMESVNANAVMYPHTITISPTKQWLFLGDNNAAATTRKVTLYEYNVPNHEYLYLGYITLTIPTGATNKTVKGIRVSLEKYIDGTVSVAGNLVTGTNTLWAASRLCAGSRIGFGSTDSNAITTWYEIASIDTDVGITLVETLPANLTNVPYVIEDLRIVNAMSAATTLSDGGLFLTKGLRPELFTAAGTTIPAAAAVDNVRGTYFLQDAATGTNTVACGCAIQNKASWTEQYVYVLNTGVKIYKYNIRAALTTVASGKTTDAFVALTGVMTPTGAISQTNNGRVCAAGHGPAPGVESLYWVTATRVYRTDLATITQGGVNWLTDSMVEIPPGGTQTYALSSALASIEYDSFIDKFVIGTSGAAGVRSYVTRFLTDGSQYDHIFLVDDKQYDGSTSDVRGVAHPSINALPFSLWSKDGVLHMVRQGATTTTNQMYALFIGAHWTYADSTGGYIITPAFDTTGVAKLNRLMVNESRFVGEDTLSIPTEPCRFYYRTLGIVDNSGSWTAVPWDGDLSAVQPGQQIQFKVVFKTIGTFCVPARIQTIGLLYEDNRTDSHYEASIAKSNMQTNTFAWIQKTSWNSAIPRLNIRVYNSITRALVLQDDTQNRLYGTWEYSTDNGVTWLAWNSAGDLVGNYVRYTANSLPNGIKVTAVLSLV